MRVALKLAVEASGRTQTEIAKAAGFSDAKLSGIISGTTGLQLVDQVAITKALGLSDRQAHDLELFADQALETTIAKAMALTAFKRAGVPSDVGETGAAAIETLYRDLKTRHLAKTLVRVANQAPSDIAKAAAVTAMAAILINKRAKL